jgi:hypothetical protein
LLIYQIITIIGKLYLKTPKLYTTSKFGSITIPKKFEMILRNLYYTSTQR